MSSLNLLSGESVGESSKPFPAPLGAHASEFTPFAKYSTARRGGAVRFAAPTAVFAAARAIGDIASSSGNPTSAPAAPRSTVRREIFPVMSFLIHGIARSREQGQEPLHVNCTLADNHS